MHKEAIIAIIAILLMVLLSQTAAERVAFGTAYGSSAYYSEVSDLGSYGRVVASEGSRLRNAECDRLFDQCISCGGARVCRHYCYAFEGRCL